MKTVSVLLASVFFTFSASAFAEEICISNATDYEALKETLPPLLKELPLRVGNGRAHEFFDAFVVFKISLTPSGKALVLDTDSWQGPLKGRVTDKSEISKICVNTANSKVTISFKNGAQPVRGVYTNNSVSIKEPVEVAVKKISEKEYREIVDKINVKAGGTSKSAATSNGGNQ